MFIVHWNKEAGIVFNSHCIMFFTFHCLGCFQLQCSVCMVMVREDTLDEWCLYLTYIITFVCNLLNQLTLFQCIIVTSIFVLFLMVKHKQKLCNELPVLPFFYDFFFLQCSISSSLPSCMLILELKIYPCLWTSWAGSYVTILLPQQQDNVRK